MFTDRIPIVLMGCIPVVNNMDTNKIDIVLEAIEALSLGFALDSVTKRKLIQNGVNLDEFIREYEIKTKPSRDNCEGLPDMPPY